MRQKAAEDRVSERRTERERASEREREEKQKERETKADAVGFLAGLRFCSKKYELSTACTTERAMRGRCEGARESTGK